MRRWKALFAGLGAMAVILVMFLRTLLDQSSDPISAGNYAVAQVQQPSLASQVTLRQVQSDLQATWLYISHQLDNIANETAGVKDILNGTRDRFRVMRLGLARQYDQHEEWRQQESSELSRLVQDRFQCLQNPPHCPSARKLVCNINRVAGFGSNMWDVVKCFAAAYGSNRTLILNSTRFKWEDVFLPISNTCTNYSNDSAVAWAGTEEDQTILYPNRNHPKILPPMLTPAVPADLARRMTTMHGRPDVWWTGQVLKYMLRLQPRVQHVIDEANTTMNFQHPIVGLHVRRTDKKTEFPRRYYPLEDYMVYVEEFYDSLELRQRLMWDDGLGNMSQPSSTPPVVRRVYLASDEPKIFPEAVDKYPQYTFLWYKVDKKPTVSLKKMQDVMVDIYFLSHCDHLVGMTGSNFFRRAFEMMQVLHPDASQAYSSLDCDYNFGWQDSSQLLRMRLNQQEDHLGKKDLEGPSSGQMVQETFNHLDLHDGNRGITYTKGDKKRKSRAVPRYMLQPVVKVVHVPHIPSNCTSVCLP